MKTRSTNKLIQRLALAGAMLATLAVGSLAQAQPGPKGPGARGGGGHRMIHRHLYPPEMVMRFSAEINLTETQRKAFLKVLKATQSAATDLKFAMLAEANKLGKLVAAAKVSEKKAIDQSDRVMKMEAKIKRLHLRLLIRIKNLLTPKQRAALDKMKRTHQPPRVPRTPRAPK